MDNVYKNKIVYNIIGIILNVFNVKITHLT